MASAGISSSSSPRGVGAATNPAGRLRVGKKVKQSASKMITAIASNRKRRSREAAASSTSHDRPSRGADADLGLGLPGPQFRPLHLCGGAYCFTAIDPAWGGGYAFYKRRKNGKWKPVFDEEMVWLLTAAVTVGGSRTMAGPQRTLGGGIGGICTALRARDVELDAGVTAHALTFLDGISLTRTESVSLSFRHEISRIAWDDLANELSLEMKDRAQKRWKVRQAAGKAIRSKDMVIYAQKEKIASDYVDEVVDMNVYELACKGRILSEVYPSADDYDIFIRFSSDDKILCEGFFDLVDDITILRSGEINTINLDGADLSQWPEMEDFLKCLRLPLIATSEDVMTEFFLGMKPWNLVFTVVAIHNRSLRPSIIFSENRNLGCESGERAWGIESDGESYIDGTINMEMDFSAYHEGEYDLNDVDAPSSQDPRQFVQGNLSLRPVVPDQIYGWTRYCCLDFDFDTNGKTPGTWRMEFRDERVVLHGN